MSDLLDVVELVTDVGRWPAGTEGTLVEVFADGVLVEISDDADGRTVELVPVPRNAVRAVHVPDHDTPPGLGPSSLASCPRAAGQRQQARCATRIG